MEILNAQALERGWKKHPQAKQWLRNWIEVVTDAEWQSLQDVRRDYPSADGVKLPSNRVVTIFNVRGNTYRLLTEVKYEVQQVICLDLLTHAEYDKQKWK